MFGPHCFFCPLFTQDPPMSLSASRCASWATLAATAATTPRSVASFVPSTACVGRHWWTVRARAASCPAWFARTQLSSCMWTVTTLSHTAAWMPRPRRQRWVVVACAVCIKCQLCVDKMSRLCMLLSVLDWSKRGGSTATASLITTLRWFDLCRQIFLSGSGLHTMSQIHDLVLHISCVWQ